MNRERRETGVFLVLREHQVPKETMVLLDRQAHSVLLVLQDYLVPLVLKELRDLQDKLVQRERLACPEFLVLLVLLAMSSTHFPSEPP